MCAPSTATWNSPLRGSVFLCMNRKPVLYTVDKTPNDIRENAVGMGQCVKYALHDFEGLGRKEKGQRQVYWPWGE